MPPLETIISGLEPPGQFQQDCAAVFGDAAGQRLLHVITTILCPILSTPAFDPHRHCPRSVEETHVAIGRNELAMALWRHSRPVTAPIPS